MKYHVLGFNVYMYMHCWQLSMNFRYSDSFTVLWMCPMQEQVYTGIWCKLSTIYVMMLSLADQYQEKY